MFFNGPLVTSVLQDVSKVVWDYWPLQKLVGTCPTCKLRLWCT